MGLKNEITDIMSWYYKLSPLVRWIISIVMVGLLLIVTKSTGYLVAPLILVLGWSLLSIENRTVSSNVLLLAGMAGMFIAIPLAGILGSLFMIFLYDSLGWSVAINTLLECLIIQSGLLLLLLWPGSRLRQAASIMDFALIGLWMGAGMEWGIGVLGQNGITFSGPVYGLFPQLPGMLGHMNLAYAAAAPSVIGLLLGLMTGLFRYLAGPDMKGQLKRIVSGSILIIVLGWIIIERLVFVGMDLNPLATWFYNVDLKGRLLVYLTYSLGVVVIVVEWLLLREYPLMSNFNETISEYRQSWKRGKQTTFRTRVTNIFNLSKKRRIIRELALGEDIKPLLLKRDIEKLNKRIVALNVVLEKGGSQRESGKNT